MKPRIYPLLLISVIGNLLFWGISCQSGSVELSTKEETLLDASVTQALDSLFIQSIRQQKIPGAVALVARKGSILYNKSFGYRDLKQQDSLAVDDIFRLASMTKPITAVAAMQLYEQGAFQLDDPLYKHLPAFANPGILVEVDLRDSSFRSSPAKNEITIRQLFTHSSGIGYGFQNDSLMAVFEKNGITEGFEERDILLADNVAKIARMPLLHEPGLQFTYGLNSDVLGYLVEVWSGMPLDEYFEEHIFEPLGMVDTYFYLPEDKTDRLVPVLMTTPEGLAETDYPLIHYPVRGAKRYLSGGADLSATAMDYYRFCQMMLNKGSLNGTQILLPETVDLMTQTHLENGREDMGLGFGIQSEPSPDRARSLGSYSWGGFFATTFWIDPEEELIGILLLQLYPFEHWEVQSEFEKIIYRKKHENSL